MKFDPAYGEKVVDIINQRLEELKDIPEYMNAAGVANGANSPIMASITQPQWDPADAGFLISAIQEDEVHLSVPPISRIYVRKDPLATLVVFLHAAFKKALPKGDREAESKLKRFHENLTPLAYCGSELWRQSMAALSVGHTDFSRFQVERIEALREFKGLVGTYVTQMLEETEYKRLFVFLHGVEKEDADNVNLMVEMLQECATTITVQLDDEE